MINMILKKLNIKKILPRLAVVITILTVLSSAAYVITPKMYTPEENEFHEAASKYGLKGEAFLAFESAAYLAGLSFHDMAEILKSGDKTTIDAYIAKGWTWGDSAVQQGETAAPIEEQPKHTHSWEESNRKEASCTEEGTIEYSCSCGKTKSEKIAKTEHTFKKKEVKTAGNCKELAVVIYECSVCGLTEERDDEYGEHSYVTDTKEPTCEETGFIKTYCEICGESKLDKEQPSLGHDYKPNTVKKATCTEEGLTEYVCDRCGLKDETQTKSIAAEGHTEAVRVSKEATTFTDGEKETYCSKCDEVLSKEVIKAPVPIWVPVGALGAILLLIITLLIIKGIKKK